MKRIFDADELVTIPLLDVGSAKALGERLLAQAKAEELEPRVARSVKRLKRAIEALSAAAQARLDAVEFGEEDRKNAFRVQIAAWGVLYDWLKAWDRMP